MAIEIFDIVSDFGGQAIHTDILQDRVIAAGLTECEWVAANSRGNSGKVQFEFTTQLDAGQLVTLAAEVAAYLSSEADGRERDPVADGVALDTLVAGSGAPGSVMGLWSRTTPMAVSSVRSILQFNRPDLSMVNIVYANGRFRATSHIRVFARVEASFGWLTGTTTALILELERNASDMRGRGRAGCSSTHHGHVSCQGVAELWPNDTLTAYVSTSDGTVSIDSYSPSISLIAQEVA